MAALTIQALVEAGITPSYAAAESGGDTAANDGDVFLHVKNTNAATRIVTVTAQKTKVTSPGMGDTTKSNVAVTIPATTGDKMIGPFPPLAFNNASGLLAITYDTVADLTIAAVRFTKPS